MEGTPPVDLGSICGQLALALQQQQQQPSVIDRSSEVAPVEKTSHNKIYTKFLKYITPLNINMYINLLHYNCNLF